MSGERDPHKPNESTVSPILMSRQQIEEDRKFIQELLSQDLSKISDKVWQEVFAPELIDELKKIAAADPLRLDLLEVAKKNAKKAQELEKTRSLKGKK
ncbi:MAG: hypothetical protein JSR17_11035 [Proteobacteria bacterium]|nr:hypothetical protein [Pseudomonadota bacterium]